MTDPRRPLHDLTDEEFERELADVKSRLSFPDTPDLAGAVRYATAARPQTPSTRVRAIGPFPLRRFLAAAVIALVAIAAALVLFDGFRTTVADLFGIRGVRITIQGDDPTPTLPASIQAPSGTPIGANLLLGERMTLDQAAAATTFPISVPTALGSPDEVYVRRLPDGNLMVSLLYHPRDDLPETAETGAGALLMQFSTTKPVEYIGKEIGDGNRMTFFTIKGKTAIWIDGAHTLTLLPDPSRGCCDDLGRQAGNVLLWESDGEMTFRFESALDRSEAIEIAESVLVSEATPVLGGN